MTQFKDFSELVDPLVLPINGKQYTIPPVGAKDGIRFTLSADPKATDVPPISDAEFFRIFLGATYDEMVEDNVPGSAVTRAAAVALADFQRGRAVAEVMWETGADPKALLAYVEANSPQRKRQGGTQRKPTAKATSTR